MNFIKKVFDGKTDNSVHLQFQKFSKGEFKDRALIKAKASGDKYTITTSTEFANELVKAMAKRLGSNGASITGAIISTADLSGELEFENKKQFQGVKKYILEKEMSGSDILNLLNKFPKSFFALSFEVGNDKLKIKPKAPKSGKPGSKGEEGPKADFCRLVTSDPEIAKSFVFEKPNFKDAEINHTFLINELILPKDEEDYAKIREIAKRKGKIIREAKIDSQTLKSEKDFVA